MQRLTPCDARFRPQEAVEGQRIICVVDPKREDYGTWQTKAEVPGLQLRFVANAEEALRLAGVERVDLWVVSTALPGLSGFDLCDMLRRQSTRVPVFLVANEYLPTTEHAAWRARPRRFFASRRITTRWPDGSHGVYLAPARSRPESPSNDITKVIVHVASISPFTFRISLFVPEFSSCKS